jgi:hypothetical protein
MMDFITMTISFTVAILLAMGLATCIMMQPRVMKWYMNYVMKSMNRFDDLLDEQKDNEL